MNASFDDQTVATTSTPAHEICPPTKCPRNTSRATTSPTSNTSSSHTTPRNVRRPYPHRSHAATMTAATTTSSHEDDDNDFKCRRPDALQDVQASARGLLASGNEFKNTDREQHWDRRSHAARHITTGTTQEFRLDTDTDEEPHERRPDSGYDNRDDAGPSATHDARNHFDGDGKPHHTANHRGPPCRETATHSQRETSRRRTRPHKVSIGTTTTQRRSKPSPTSTRTSGSAKTPKELVIQPAPSRTPTKGLGKSPATR